MALGVCVRIFGVIRPLRLDAKPRPHLLDAFHRQLAGSKTSNLQFLFSSCLQTEYYLTIVQCFVQRCHCSRAMKTCLASVVMLREATEALESAAGSSACRLPRLSSFADMSEWLLIPRRRAPPACMRTMQVSSLAFNFQNNWSEQMG